MKRRDYEILKEEERKFDVTLNKLIKSRHEKVKKILDENKILDYSMKVEGEDIDNLLKEYLGDNSIDFTIKFSFSTTGYRDSIIIDFLYKGVAMDPRAHYVRIGKRRTTILETLRECIKQDDPNPRIFDLENDIVVE